MFVSMSSLKSFGTCVRSRRSDFATLNGRKKHPRGRPSQSAPPMLFVFTEFVSLGEDAGGGYVQYKQLLDAIYIYTSGGIYLQVLNTLYVRVEY